MAKAKVQNLSREIIYNRLREDIVYCRLKPGERLIEDDLTKRFNVSRSPLREALSQLQAENFVEYSTNKGVRVARLSVEDVDEIYSIRAVLEGYGARLAAEHVTPQDIKKLGSLQEQLKRHVKNNDVSGWLENNTKFHFCIAEISRNKNLFGTIEQLQRRVFRYGYISVSIPGHMEEYISMHQKVIEEITQNQVNTGVIQKVLQNLLRGVHRMVRRSNEELAAAMR